MDYTHHFWDRSSIYFLEAVAKSLSGQQQSVPSWYTKPVVIISQIV